MPSPPIFRSIKARAGHVRYVGRNPPEGATVSEHEQELDQPGLDDEERAFRNAQRERDHEQDDADNDVAPSPADDEE
jgi:hypothetical protein